MTSVAGRDVALYVEDDSELAVLEPIGAEMARRGARVRVSEDFEATAEIGLYACHANRFFDFDAACWRRPENRLSVLTLHDLAQAGNLDAEYFSVEPWHAFDVGLLPSAEWKRMWERAQAGGAEGPSLGMHVVGWPKMDHAFSAPEMFAARVAGIQRGLGLTGRPVVLLACSWPDRRQLSDALAALDEDLDLIVKYPVSSSPRDGSPWFDRLSEAFAELQRTREVADAHPRVIVAPAETDIMALTALADMVLSNGSNVLYEAVLMGTPGISVRDWIHPSGPHGEETVRPHVDLSGVLSGDLASLSDLLEVVRRPEWEPLVARGSESLVGPGTRGAAAIAATDVIEHFAESSVRRTESAGTSNAAALTLGRDELARMREALEAADEREERARKQLREYETELARLRAL